jgi:hypothetical protein
MHHSCVNVAPLVGWTAGPHCDRKSPQGAGSRRSHQRVSGVCWQNSRFAPPVGNSACGRVRLALWLGISSSYGAGRTVVIQGPVSVPRLSLLQLMGVGQVEMEITWC